MINLVAAVHCANINPLDPHQFKWGVADKKEFSVKAAYKLLGLHSTITELAMESYLEKQISSQDKLLQLDCQA